MNHEDTARAAHRSGSNCAASVYNAFGDINPTRGEIPRPRGEGGMCGAVLAARQVLKELGVANDFDQRFTEVCGSLKCADLRRARIPCNDLVGVAAKLTEAYIEKSR